MSFYFLYFFCIFLRKTTRIKWCRTVFFIFCKYTRIFILFLLIIFLVFWAFWSLLPWLASIKLKDLLAGQTSDFLLNMSWTFVITHKIMENYCTISKRKIWLYERLHVGILQHHWCRIFYLKTSRGSFSQIMLMYTYQSQKVKKIRFVTRTKSDFSVIYNHLSEWTLSLYKSLFW